MGHGLGGEEVVIAFQTWKGLNGLSPDPVAFKVGDHRTLGLQEGISGIPPIMKNVLTK